MFVGLVSLLIANIFLDNYSQTIIRQLTIKTKEIHTKISFGFSANKCLYLKASVRIRHLCSDENFMESTFLSFFITKVKSWFATELECLAEAMVITSAYSHLLVTSRRSGLYVVIPWVPTENTLLYFPFQECLVTRNDTTSWLSFRGIMLTLPEKFTVKTKIYINFHLNRMIVTIVLTNNIHKLWTSR